MKNAYITQTRTTEMILQLLENILKVYFEKNLIAQALS